MLVTLIYIIQNERSKIHFLLKVFSKKIGRTVFQNVLLSETFVWSLVFHKDYLLLLRNMPTQKFLWQLKWLLNSSVLVLICSQLFYVVPLSKNYNYLNVCISFFGACLKKCWRCFWKYTINILKRAQARSVAIRDVKFVKSLKRFTLSEVPLQVNHFRQIIIFAVIINDPFISWPARYVRNNRKTVDRFRLLWNNKKESKRKFLNGEVSLHKHSLKDGHHSFEEDVSIFLIDKTDPLNLIRDSITGWGLLKQ